LNEIARTIPGSLSLSAPHIGRVTDAASTAAAEAAGALARRLRPDAFGAEPAGERLERILRSPNFSDGAFRNPVPTRRGQPGSVLSVLRSTFLAEDRARREPADTIPVRPLTADHLAEPPVSGLRVTWMGHAGVLAEIDGRRVLFDPVWGERCSPVPGFGPRRLHPAPIPLDELGPVDAVVVSHDHYDHLDMPTIRGLVDSGAVFAVPLGLGAHLELWGVRPDRIVELDWNESAEAAGLRMTAVPARHYCSRGPRTSPLLLWASWVVESPRHRLYHSGDTGYFPGFAAIGAEHGPFDVTMVQIGAYSSELWPDVHMTPEEGVRAHRDLGGELMLPIHWGTFNLAPHAWDEPAERTVAAAEASGVSLAIPRVGEPFEPAKPPVLDPWWRAVAAPCAARGRAPVRTASPVPTAATP
jgi:L-ascorbate metabolism protein UlaG (beta-lactamase superfamily)